MDDKVLSNDLKENSKKHEKQFQEEIFAAKAAVLQSYENSPEENDFGADQERFEAQQAAKENHERYGENLTSEAARRCFSKEFVALKNKFEKVKRAEEKEKEISIKDSQKSYKKRLKDGILQFICREIELELGISHHLRYKLVVDKRQYIQKHR